MSKDLYPNVKFQEIDLSTFVRSNASSIGGTVGRFEKGPVGRAVLVSDKNDLLENFGIPRDGTFNNLQDWYTVNNFLAYAAGIYVVRAENEASLNSGKNFDDTATDLSSNIYVGDGFDMSSVSGLTDTGLNIIGKNPGTWGNYIKVGMALYADITEDDGYYYDNEVVVTVGTLITDLAVNDYVIAENGATGLVTAIGGVSDVEITVHYNGTAFVPLDNIHEGQTYSASDPNIQTIAAGGVGTVTVIGYETFMGNFSEQLEANQIAISIYVSDDEGTTYTIRENHIVSTVITDKTFDGKAMYVDYYLEQNSKYISSIYVSSGAALTSYTTAEVLTGGTLDSGSVMSQSVIEWDENFKDKDALGVNILIDGSWAGNTTVMNNIIAIAEFRQDCFVVLSAGTSITVTTETLALADLEVMRNALTTSTYAGFYGNYKVQYDAYSGRNFNCSISGDIAGIFARNDILAQPWYAPSGYNRGSIQNVVKLPVTFSKTNQGTMHTKQINLIVEDKKIGGFYVLSQKTAYARPSAFGDINVRRLLTYCENSIIDAARAFQWEFNDALTRSQLQTITSNFMDSVKGKNGVYNFLAVCDTTNNTADIIDNNELYLDVFIKPTKAIGWITLRFTATRTDANFEEMVA